MTSFIFPAILILSAFVLGIIAGKLSSPKYKNVGRFNINKGDPKKPAFWLELDHDLDVLERQAVIGFTIIFHQPDNDLLS